MQNLLKIYQKGNKLFINVNCALTIDNLPLLKEEFSQIKPQDRVVIDLSGVREFDANSIIFLNDVIEEFKRVGEVEVVGANDKLKELLNILKPIKSDIKPKKESFLEGVGKNVVEAIANFIKFLNFLGEFIVIFFRVLTHPKEFRFKETAYHIYHSGYSAVLIITITMFLVGMVIAYQGAVQLAKFGADIFIVDTVGISITRELSPIVVAIVIAGRSGSAYTAEIGSMKLTQEIDAMKTMGFEPFRFLVIPRVVALVLVMPLLVFWGDIVGIFGGIVASKLQLNIFPSIFIHRLYEVLALKHYLLGIFKAPFFAFIIALIGCYRGFLVSNNTQSIGLQTTASVVNAIFFVIALDALFSVIFTRLGI